MKKIPFSLIFLLSSLASYGQYGFTEAVLITKQNDTITCEVLRAITYNNKVTYRMTASSPELSISVKDVRSISTAQKYSENIPLGKKEKMMGLLVDGDVKLFNHVTINEGASTPAAGGTMTLYTAPTILYAIKKDNIFYEIKKKNFQEMITTLFSDCQSVVDKVVSKTYTLEEIETLVNEYNSCK